MCIGFFFIDGKEVSKNKFSFVLVFNREEYFNRNTLPLNYFKEDNNILAGRDEKESGTWLGINKLTGNIAFLTNFTLGVVLPDKISRGKIIYDALKTDFYNKNEQKFFENFKDNKENFEIINEKLQNYIENIRDNKEKFNPFNLVIGNLFTRKFFFVGNPHNEKIKKNELDENFFSICNLSEFSQKETKREKTGKEIFEKIINNQEISSENLFKELSNLMENAPIFLKKNTIFEVTKKVFEFEQSYNDEYLEKIKNTEKSLSEYGTRSMTTILLDCKNNLYISEIFYGNNEEKTSFKEFSLNL